MKTRHIGLRLYEIETGFASNLDPHSPALRHFRNTRLAGQAIRLAQLIRGMDVIEDLDRLVAIAAGQLGIDPMHYDTVLEILQNADLIDLRGTKIYEKVRQIDFGENYERIGDLWLQKKPDIREEAVVGLLDEVIDRPRKLTESSAVSGLGRDRTNLVLQVSGNSHVIEQLRVGTGSPILYTPLLWDVQPEKLRNVLSDNQSSGILKMIGKMQIKAGTEVESLNLTQGERKLANKAIAAGLLPTIPVDSVGGRKEFTFTPYSGKMISGPTEREILGRARALVACVRYGQRHAVASKIKWPKALLSALMDASRKHMLAPHGEMKEQYAQLVKRGVGKVYRVGGSYQFRLIPSEENIRAVRLAIELVSAGEILKERGDVTEEQRAALFASGKIGTELDGIRLASERPRATDDELEELVETLRR